MIELITAPLARVTVSAIYPGEDEPFTVFQGRADAEGNLTADWVVPVSKQTGVLALQIVSRVVGAEKSLEFQMTLYQ